MKWYLSIDNCTGRCEGAVLASNPSSAKALASKLFGWRNPVFRSMVPHG